MTRAEGKRRLYCASDGTHAWLERGPCGRSVRKDGLEDAEEVARRQEIVHRDASGRRKEAKME